MLKRINKYLNPFEITLVVSMLTLLFITLIIYIDKKSNEKLKFFVYKTQEKSILRLITQLEDTLAKQDFFLNKIHKNLDKPSLIKDNLIIIENNKIVFSNVNDIDISFFQNISSQSQNIFFASYKDNSFFGSYKFIDGKIFLTFTDFDKIIKENIFGENILINSHDGKIVYASEYKDFFNTIRNKIGNNQFSVISGGEEIAVTTITFHDDYNISIYAPFKYYYSDLSGQNVKIGIPAFIFGFIIFSLLFAIKLSVNRFITEKEKYETLFQLEHEKFQRIVQSIDEGVALITKDYEIIWINDYIAKKIPNIKSGKCFKELSDKEYKCSICMLEKVFTEKRSYSVTTKDFIKGEKGFYDVIWVPLMDKHGEVTACVELIRDITAIVEMQNKVVQSEKLSALGLLAGGVAHEINNPLVGILNMSQLLSRRFPENSKEKDMIELIIEAGKETKNIVQSLLDYARQGTTKMERFDIRESINFALKIFGSKLKNKKIVIKNNIDRPIIVNANKGKIHQVFINLLSNSIDAIEENGEITIDYIKNGNKTILKIRDNGKGISHENLDKIFDPFFTTKDVGKGTGLGLSITHGIIKEHGWNIDVESELNNYTTFKIIIENSEDS